MSPHRAKTYVRLFAALSLSVLANLLLFQPRLAVRSHAGGAVAETAGQPRRAETDKPDVRRPETGNPQASAMRLAVIAPAFNPTEQMTETVRSIQRELKDLGHYPGPIDGRASQLTHAAIFAYQQQHGLTITAEPTEDLSKLMVLGSSTGPGTATGRPAGSPAVAPGSPAEKLVADICQILTALGLDAGRGPGRMTPEFIRAIRTYETDNGLLPPTGRISAALVAHLQRKAAAVRAKAG